MTFVRACAKGDVSPGSIKGVSVKGVELVLTNVEGKICAMDGICSHRGGPLAEGVLEGTTLMCPWHHSGFDCRTGAVAKQLPPQYGQATPLKTFPVKVEGEDVLVDV